MLRKGHSRYKLLREVYTDLSVPFLLIMVKGRENQLKLVGKRFFFYSAIIVNQ